MGALSKTPDDCTNQQNDSERPASHDPGSLILSPERQWLAERLGRILARHWLKRRSVEMSTTTANEGARTP